MKAEILSYSRSRGVFAGLALTGATLRPDLEDNEALYGKKLTSKEIVDTGVKPTPEAAKLTAELSRYSSREQGDRH
jgi:lipid-binding SYLF domain-containing protein